MGNVSSIAEACDFLLKNVKGIVAMAPAKLQREFPGWTILEVAFESMEQKHEAMKCTKIKLDNDEYADIAPPLSKELAYHIMRFEGAIS